MPCQGYTISLCIFFNANEGVSSVPICYGPEEQEVFSIPEEQDACPGKRYRNLVAAAGDQEARALL